MQIPAAAGNAYIGANAVADFRPVGQLLDETGSARFRVASNEQRQGSEFIVTQRRDDAAALFDQRQFRAMLPDAEGLAFFQANLDRLRVDLTDIHVFHPRKLHELAARRIDVECNQRGAAIKAEKLEDIDFGGLQIAGDLHVLNGETRSRGRRLRNDICVAAERHAIKAGHRVEGDGRNRAGMGGNVDASGRKADAEAHNTTQRARQHHAVVGICRRCELLALFCRRLFAGHRKHEASSTIQLTRLPKERPAWAAISGTREVGVMPGCVFTSSQITSPSSEKRSS
ncbi:hypothetical protein D3C72_942760 [compost metagenome]